MLKDISNPNLSTRINNQTIFSVQFMAQQIKVDCRFYYYSQYLNIRATVIVGWLLRKLSQSQGGPT